jgi:hypothetical protein
MAFCRTAGVPVRMTWQKSRARLRASIDAATPAEWLNTAWRAALVGSARAPARGRPPWSAATGAQWARCPPAAPARRARRRRCCSTLRRTPGRTTAPRPAGQAPRAWARPCRLSCTAAAERTDPGRWWSPASPSAPAPSRKGARPASRCGQRRRQLRRGAYRALRPSFSHCGLTRASAGRSYDGTAIGFLLTNGFGGWLEVCHPSASRADHRVAPLQLACRLPARCWGGPRATDAAAGVVAGRAGAPMRLLLRVVAPRAEPPRP